MEKCPLCKCESRIIKTITRKDIIEGYEHIYNGKIDKDMFDEDYLLRECKKCNLIFADPMKPGNDKFYSWITSQENYYPTKDTPRWEWKETVEYIRKNKISSILEIGCGAGDFLEYCKKNIENIKCVGIDMTESSCEKCKQKGLEVFCGTVEDFKKNYPEKKYDMVVSFHCLEHVSNPLEFVEDAIELCNQQGRCIHSFPYSDKKIEPWMDCGNLPPHHMTRWCEKACKILGESIQAEVKLVSPKSDSIYQNTKQNLIYLWFPLYKINQITRYDLLKKCVKHPLTVIKELYRNVQRDNILASTEIDGVVTKRKASYVILVVMQKIK